MKTNSLHITINTGEKTVMLQAPRGKQLKGLLSDAGIKVTFPCAGMGRCGKCRVRFTKGAPKASFQDKSFLSEKEIEDGVRLLCRAVLTEDAEIVLEEGQLKEEKIYAAGKMLKTMKKNNPAPETMSSFGAAIDIGTTTIGLMIIGMNPQGEQYIYGIFSGTNHQRTFGADVISRIAAAGEGHGDELFCLIRDDILELIENALAKFGVKKLDVITITGNTTMLHLLRGYDVTGLGRFPYEPYSLKPEKISAFDLWGNDIPEYLRHARVLIMPGISAFVGADIVADIYAANMIKKSYSELLIDLGTNGEMVFWDGSELFVTSTAAGPVFEAGGISCGMAAVPGAISEVYIKRPPDSGRFEVKLGTISNKEPVGICGSGVLEAVSELVRNKFIDETGLLTEEYFSEGFPLTTEGKEIRLTQNDIRNVQLGKAALYAAQKELLKGKKPEYIAVSGGYGVSLMAEKLRYLKLFPYEESHVYTSPYSALSGCMLLLKAALKGTSEEEKIIAELDDIVKRAHVVELSNKDNFTENYVDAMNF